MSECRPTYEAESHEFICPNIVDECQHQLDFGAQYKVVETTNDGNCMFAAFADQLGQPLSASHNVRQELVEFIRNHHGTLVSCGLTIAVFVHSFHFSFALLSLRNKVLEMWT
jgi:hypothetical protein